MSKGQMVAVEALVKVYPNGVRAVSGIDFVVAQGEFFGFLGPNGAGKSTTIKILATLLRKTSGRVVVAGYDIDEHPAAVRRHIGFAMQEVGLDDLSSGRDFLIMQGLLYGQSRKEAQRRAEELLELVGLTSVASRKIGTYSGGMRRRIDLVGALMHSPTLLFLDEPTTGLDPQSRLAIWEYIEELNKQGKTIFLTTQLMEEADRLCERIAIIDNGKIVAEGTPKGLKNEVGGDVVTVTIDSSTGEGQKAEIAKASTLIGERRYVLGVNTLDTGVSITVRDSGSAVPDLIRLLQENNISVANVSLSSPSLDDVFLKYTGRKIRVDESQRQAGNRSLRPWLRIGRR